MFENEDHYWWFVSRRELVVSLVVRLDLPGEAHLLDVGCGTGATAAALRRFGRVTGADFSTLALARCQRRGLRDLVQGKAEALPLASGSVDVIVATDILEHLDDDLAALEEFRRVLRPGGYAVISVPAYQMLWGEHDLALMHRRRYTAGLLHRQVRRAGFETARLSYALCFLLPMALLRLVKRKQPAGKMPEAQLWRVPKWVNAALVGFQRLETALLTRVGLPCGLSVVAVIQKPVRAASSGGPHLARGSDPVIHRGQPAAR